MPDPKQGGEPDPNNPENQDPENKPVTQAELGKMVSGAVTNHVAKALKGLNLGELIGTHVKEAVGSLKDELVTELKPQEPSRPKNEPDERDKKIETLTKQIQTLTSSIEEERNRGKAAQLKQRRTDAAIALRSALDGKVLPELLDVVVRDLMNGRELVAVPEDGDPTMKVKVAPWSGAQEEEQELPLSDAIGHWLKTKDAEPFLPAPGTQAKKTPGPNSQHRSTTRPGQTAELSKDPAERALQMLQMAGVEPDL